MLFRWKDDATWKRFIPLANDGNVDAIREALSEFTSFAVYHGCRPGDPMAYYQDGLKIADLESLNQRAEQIFLTEEFPSLTRARLEEAIDQDSKGDDGKLFAVLDGEYLLEFSPGYLIYGSEHLMRLVNRISGRGMPYLDVLKRFGIPTLFEIHIPAHELPQDRFELLASSLFNVCSDRDVDQRPWLNFSFEFQNRLPGDWIKNHINPEELVDRLDGCRAYRFKEEK